MPEELWSGRFEGDPSEALRALNDSLAVDRRMFREDIAGSRAHVSMLAETGALTAEERDQILGGLDHVEQEIASGKFEEKVSDEDIHTAVERRLIELIGPVGGKLHTARSRNDQVALDVRLWLRSALTRDVVPLVLGLQKTLVSRAQQHADDYMPGYTHMQQAQVVSVAHHFLAHFWALGRDVDRLFATVDRMDVSPLGAGAIAGTGLDIDPGMTAAMLGFSSAFENSMDAVSDRDHVAEALFDISLLGTHLSRLSEEVIIWATSEFGFVNLDDAYATGSSMMPQKKNPDVAEITRSKAGRLIGNLTGFLATLKGLPLTYNKDLQEDKAAMFDSVDTICLVLAAFDGMVATMTFNTDVMRQQADSPMAGATDLADHLVRTGMAFRDAHTLIAELVAKALAGPKSLAGLVADDPRLGDEAAALLKPGAMAGNRTSPGGASPSAVATQLEHALAHIETDEARVADRIASFGGG